jgi:hypothetical protein
MYGSTYHACYMPHPSHAHEFDNTIIIIIIIIITTTSKAVYV